VQKAEALSQGKTNVKVWDLFRPPVMRILSFNIMFTWFTISMVFYGLALNGGNLAGKLEYTHDNTPPIDTGKLACTLYNATNFFRNVDLCSALFLI